MAHRNPLVSLLAVTVSLSCSSQDREPAAQSTGQAWYIAARIEPTDSALFGIPIRLIDSTWLAAVVLSASVLPAEADADTDTRPTSDFGYRIDGDFDRDGQADFAVVGVFRAHDGTKGAFALILTEAETSVSKRFVASLTGSTEVTFLRRAAADTLRWADCVACDADPVIIYWNGHEYVHRWDPDEPIAEPSA